jgi:hypothetical protein
MKNLSKPILSFVSLLPLAILIGDRANSQNTGESADAQMSLRRSLIEREYNGKRIEGEERTIAAGDSLWRILIQEKRLPVNKFNEYVLLIRGLNPKIKNTDVLRLGENIFVPVRLDDSAGTPSTPAHTDPSVSTATAGIIREYRVRQGDSLYLILREQLGITDQREQATYYALVKDLNRERTQWDILQQGEVIRLPTVKENRSRAIAEIKRGSLSAGKSVLSPKDAVVTQAKSDPRQPFALDYARRLDARENLSVLEKVAMTVGSEIQRDGQEVIALKNGTVVLDRSAYPVIYNPRLRQRVIIDSTGQIPITLRKSAELSNGTLPIISFKDGASLEEIVTQLLAQLGFQTLSSDRPVVIQEGGVTFEAKGTWMALAPQESNKAQELFVIALTDRPGDIPEYLTEQLSAKGLHLKEVELRPSPTELHRITSIRAEDPPIEMKTWPRDNKEIIDVLLSSLKIPFTVGETVSVELRQGLRVNTTVDRTFEARGQRTALFFDPVEAEIKQLFTEQQQIRVLELELSSFSSRGITERLLPELGESAVYREHRFSVETGNKDRLNISTRGLLLQKHSMFITDQQIPVGLYRFFFEKGLKIVYLQ